MAQQLKNTLAFTLVPGASVVLPHGLQLLNGTPLAPDIIFLPSDALSVSSDTVNVTLTNDGPVELTGSVLVEAWHTIERAFGDEANVDLPVKPYIVVSAESGNEPPQPPFPDPLIGITIYARATGSDVDGTGKTPTTAYRTVQRATRDIPSIIPAGVYYTIDATGLIDGGPEVLPPNYALPVWKAPTALFEGSFPDPFFPFRCAVTLRADLRDVPALGADAIINEADLEFPAVGNGIVSASFATPIVITTTDPHGLVESPLGLQFGVDEGFVQVVSIDGVAGNAAADGVFFALVTGPKTFELYDFDLNPVVGVGAGLGGTLTVFFVKDPKSGQVQVKISTPRASWVPGSLKGKLLPTGPSDNIPIYDNTNDTLFLATLFPPDFAFGPLHISEQSCVLQCSDSVVFDLVGGFNVVNQDSIFFGGIEIRASADGSGFFQNGGNAAFHLGCRYENPVWDGVPEARTIDCYFVQQRCTCAINQRRCVIDGADLLAVDHWFASGGTVLLNQEGTLGGRDEGLLDWLGVKVISVADPVLISTNGDSSFTSVSIEGGSGDAVVADTQGRTKLLGVGGSGWPGTALVVDNGAQVEVDAFTFLDADMMQVGLSPTSLPARTFLSFRTIAPQFNQLDVTAVAPGGGTASRVFQRP